MTARYLCPWCPRVEWFLGKDRFLNHLFGYHQDRIIERLERRNALRGSFGTRKSVGYPRSVLKVHPPLSPGVSGEGDS